MYFHCVLILALVLVQNEAKRFNPFKGDPSRALRSGSPKLDQGSVGSLDTAMELAKLIQKVKKQDEDEKVIEKLSTPEVETPMQVLFNAIQKKIENEGIRIHVLKNKDVLDKYKQDKGSRVVLIDNPEVLEKYVNELKKHKTDDNEPLADFEDLVLKRRSAVFRLDEPGAEGSKSLGEPSNAHDTKHIRKRYEGSDDDSKRFNKVSNKRNDDDWDMPSGKKQRDKPDRSREVGRGREKENRGSKNDRDRGAKREFKDYPEFQSQGNPNLSRNKPKKVADYDYDKPKKPKKSRDFDDEFDSKKTNRNKDKFDDYGGEKKKDRDRGAKREFKDYPEFQSQGNPNLSRNKPKRVADYDYDKPKKPKKSRDFDDEFDNKKSNRNKDKFDDYGGEKKKGGWGQSMGSEPKRKPQKTNWDDKPKRTFENEKRRPKSNDGGWAPSISGGSNDYAKRPAREGGGAFGNTPIPFNLPRNIYVNENGE